MAQHVQHSIFGVDVDSRFLQINCYGQAQVTQLDNHRQAIAAWLKTLSGPVSLALEATGTYHLELVEQAHQAGVTVYLLNPRWLHHYRASVGQRAKNDRCDAQLIARYLAHEQPQLRPFQPLNAAQRRAWQLLKRRATLVRIKDQLRQSFRDMTPFRATTQALTRRIDTLIHRLETHLANQLKQAGLGEAVQRCQSIPGVGPLTAMALVIAMDRGHFTNAEALVAYLGLDVRVRESGRYVGQRKLTKQGDGEYRRLLFNAAMTASRTAFRRDYERLLARGKASTQAHVAIARKLVRIAFSLVKHRQSFDLDRLQCA